MAKYQFNIKFNSEDVYNINSTNQKVTLVKSVEGSSGSGVAWVSFHPYETNIVTWEQDYAVYASNVEVQSGAKIQKLSDRDAYPLKDYIFKEGTFEAGADFKFSDSNTYGIVNQNNEIVTFGLAQPVTVNNKISNGANPINAVQVLNKQNARFTPIEKVKIYISSIQDNGLVISNISGPSLEVDFTAKSEQTVQYVNNQFQTIALV